MNKFELIISILLRAISVGILAIGVMPLVIKEARIKDKIIFLRMAIPIMLVAIIIVTLAEDYILTCALNDCYSRFWTDQLILGASIGNVIVAIVLYLIYRKKYQDEP